MVTRLFYKYIKLLIELNRNLYEHESKKNYVLNNSKQQ